MYYTAPADRTGSRRRKGYLRRVKDQLQTLLCSATLPARELALLSLPCYSPQPTLFDECKLQVD